MANSRKTPQPDLLARIAACLARHFSPSGNLPRICVGLSGGLDSVVLLHLLAAYRRKHPCELSAIHVHHGLSSNADGWAEFVCRFATALDIHCTVERVEVRLRHELGLEAAARMARYAVFERQSCDYLLLAQHRDDQTETVLLNLLRGSGVRGLAAMPECRALNDRIRLVRPLLNVPRMDLLNYARNNGLEWIEDESNADCTLERNYLRHEVLPSLRQRFPGIDVALTRSAQHLAESDFLLDEIAQADLAGVSDGKSFDLFAARTLSEPRRRNVLRCWLRQAGIVPDARAFDQLLLTMDTAREDAEPVWRWRQREVRRYRGRLYPLGLSSVAGPCVDAVWFGAGRQEIPAWRGCLYWQPSEQTGIAAHFLSGGFTLCPRRGGERIRLRRNGPSRLLKHLWQEAGVPPWLRDNTPLLWIDGKLAAVPGFWIAAEFADPGGWQVSWIAI